MDNKKIWEEGREYSAPLPSFEHLKEISYDEPLLDVGCGHGRLIEHLKNLGYFNLYGVDFVFPPLRTLSLAKIALGRAEKLPFKSETFSFVSLVGVLSSILDDKKRKETFEEARRVLKKGGKLYIAAFAVNKYYKEKYRRGMKEFGKYGIFRSDSGGIFRHTTEEEIHYLLSGFEIKIFKRQPFTTMHGNRAEGFVALVKRI